MTCGWIVEAFHCVEFSAPFVIEKDISYYPDLSNKYRVLLKRASGAGADDDSLAIIEKYSKKVLDSIRRYYRADISGSNAEIKNLIAGLDDCPLASSSLYNSPAFPGKLGSELQLFRSRTGNASLMYSAKEMLPLPRSFRSKSGSYRFSIPGNPCYYLSNTSYGCWIETGLTPEADFNVSPVLLDGKQKILNLAVSSRIFFHLNNFGNDEVHCWLKLIILMFATSYRIKEPGRSFKSEYIVSQSLMLGAKKLGFDGVAYFSKRVRNDAFSLCAVNLALFMNYRKKDDYPDLVDHIKLDDSFNYSVFKQLMPCARAGQYELRSVKNPYIVNISTNNEDRQFSYRDTEFYEFDCFLFDSWDKKRNGRDKNSISWGHAIE